MFWLAQENPEAMNEFLRMPILDYWFLLDTKYKAVKEEIKQMKKKAGK